MTKSFMIQAFLYYYYSIKHNHEFLLLNINIWHYNDVLGLSQETRFTQKSTTEENRMTFYSCLG